MMPPARYPNFEGKHRHDAIFSPAEVMASQAANRQVVGPETVILTYQLFCRRSWKFPRADR